MNYRLDDARMVTWIAQTREKRDALPPLRTKVRDAIGDAGAAMKHPDLVAVMDDRWNTQVGVQCQSTYARAASGCSTRTKMLNAYRALHHSQVEDAAVTASHMPADMNTVNDRRP